MTTKDQARSTEEAFSTERALKLALEALENATSYGSLTGADWVFEQVDKAIAAIKEALITASPLAAPVQEPVACHICNGSGFIECDDFSIRERNNGKWGRCLNCKPYTTPPNVATPLDETSSLAAPDPEDRKRQSARSAWVGLTDKEIMNNDDFVHENVYAAIRSMEALLKEKNSD